MSIYKTENALIDELDNLQKLTVKDLKISSFFGRGKNYFIQVVGNSTPADDQTSPNERMHAHYYHLKKLCRKRSVPIFAYKIDARDFT